MPDNDPTTPDTLVKALFAIDARSSADVFEGWHNPDRHWNGFARPSFDQTNALKVIAWVTDHEIPEASPRTTFRWDGETLIMTETFDDGEQHDEQVGPDPHGRYWIGADSWTWKEIEVSDGVSLDVWLQRTNEDTHVYVTASHIANTWAIEAGIGWPERRDPTTLIARNAVAHLERLRPASPEQPLSSAALIHLNVDESETRPASALTWIELTEDQRAKLLDLAVYLATQTQRLWRVFNS